MTRSLVDELAHSQLWSVLSCDWDIGIVVGDLLEMEKNIMRDFKSKFKIFLISSMYFWKVFWFFLKLLETEKIRIGGTMEVMMFAQK